MGKSNAEVSLSTSVYFQLKRDILSGEFKPGEKLKVGVLSDRYEAGGSPVREALSRLTASGLVESLENRGFWVPSLFREELDELYMTRACLEEVALRKSIESGGQEWEEAVVLATHRLSKVKRLLPGDRPNPEWDEVHREFHETLISGCGSRWMIKFCNELHDQADRYRQLARLVVHEKRDIFDEHRKIADAAIAYQADEAVELLLTHYEKTREIILDSEMLG